MCNQSRHAYPPRKLYPKVPGHRAPTAVPLGRLQGKYPARMLRGARPPQPRKLSASRSQRGAPTLTYVSAWPPFRTTQTRGGPGTQHTGSTSPPAPAGEHGSVTPSPARRAVPGSPTPEHISLENLPSQGGGPGTNIPTARMTSEKIIHQGTRSRNTHAGAHGDPSSWHTTCEHVMSKGRGWRDKCDTSTNALASENVEHQGSGSQNTCGGGDGRGPREPPRYAKGRSATKPNHPDLRQPH